MRAYASNTAGTAYGNQITVSTESASFSVSASTRVLFSPGNLQWSAKNGGSTATTHVTVDGTAAGTWRFAPNQWDTIGVNNKYISSSYSGWIDLFGWGTSGYNDPDDAYSLNYYPYSSSSSIVNTTYNYFGYSPSINMVNIHISGTNYDWGVYNAIYNPQTRTTDAPRTWRTLTTNEWDYLINNRSTTSGIRYAKATMNGVPGLILVPDSWKSSIYTLNNPNYQGADYDSNVISAAQWNTLENAGCVFLPVTGFRTGVSFTDIAEGNYWSTSTENSGNAGYLYFTWAVMGVDFRWLGSGEVYRYLGLAVRLVRSGY